MKTDNPTITPISRRSQGRYEMWKKRREKFEKMYGQQSVGAYQSIANPTPSFKDWAVNQHGSITSYTDWMQPEFQLHRYGGSFVLRESNLLAGEKSLAQECRIPVRDENGLFIGYQDELDQNRKAA